MAKRHTPQRHPRDDDDSRHSTTSISSDDSDDDDDDDLGDDDDALGDDDDDPEEEEDRGDNVGNRRDDDDSDDDDDDDADEDDEDDDTEEEDDTDDLDEETLRDIGGTGTVPLGRLNEVLEQNRQLTERLIALSGGNQPAAPETHAAPAFDIKAKTKERNAKLLEGDEDAAASLDAEIAEHYQQQAAVTATNAARAVIEQDRTNMAVAEVMRDYPQLNDANKKTFDAGALKEVVTLRNGYIQDGMSVADALRKAAKRLLGKAKVEPEDEDEDRPSSKGGQNRRTVKQLRGAMKKAQRIPPSLRNAGGSGRPVGGDLTAEQLANMPESKFRRIDAKAKAKARGDFVEKGGDD